ncbi:nucleotide sugar dehydrogenase [Winogradskyella maritima]|uniref:Nucleotide sugar dehydrogenase n=1 Tax=Winogradskyella maritima TaxID=1517766 RepID=A0ABV8AHE1_9FLAO|nr:nucleotide sugar dehydrogenase [Winogradskyella maritima]
MKDNPVIAVVGLGYVGLPLAVEFAKQFKVLGYDIKVSRVQDLNKAKDRTLEVESSVLQEVLTSKTAKKGLNLTSIPDDIKEADVYIVTVPTPTDDLNKPVLTPLADSSVTVGACLSKGNIVIYESTVYPGVTEEFCVPILEANSGLTYNTDFFVGYSPERINPGDKTRTITKILKVTSGSTPQIATYIDELYAKVITAGTYLAPSIKVAEAAKVIENSQRDINIAFVNELSKIFRLLDIDTKEVLKAAGTKWNFLNFTPGLVGGHCIGVDPYYLAQKAIEVGYDPEIILAGRKMNDSMGKYVAEETVKLMINRGTTIKDSKVLVLGIAFKENCPDIRNSRVIDIIKELKSFNVEVTVCDPWASEQDVKKEYGFDLLKDCDDLNRTYDAIILAVAHNEFIQLNLEPLKHDHTVVFDVKSVLPSASVDARL